jgi:ubiquinone/menaquinone biosynthesis C-methylase UbiE
MQDDSGPLRALSTGWIYSLFQNVAGARRARQWLADNVWKCSGAEKVVDLGCGTGDVLEHLPSNVRYVGIDISEDYVELARRRFGDRGVFLVGTARTFLERDDSELMNADLMVCNGVLHHLDDEEVLDVLRLAAKILRPEGRLTCFEPTYVSHQSRFSRWIMSRDRGKNIRSEAEWNAIAETVFPGCSTRVVTGMLRLPYIHIVIECRSPAPSTTHLQDMTEVTIGHDLDVKAATPATQT